MMICGTEFVDYAVKLGKGMNARTVWLNETRLSLPHFSTTVRSLERREAEMFLWSWILVEA